MNIKYMDEILEIEENSNLISFLQKQGLIYSTHLIIYNGNTLTAEQLENISLKENDTIEAVKFIVGG